MWYRPRSFGLLAGLLLLPSFSHAVKEDTSDAVAKAWKARAELATKRLAAGQLDACDAAKERAFQGYRSQSMPLRSFSVIVHVGDSRGIFSWDYSGNTVDTFAAAGLPPTWILTQKADSKLVSVLLGQERCAFDLCSNDPLSDGPCPAVTH